MSLLLTLDHTRPLDLAFYVLGLAITISIGYGIYNVFFHPLSSFPGPRHWALSRFPFVYSLQRGDLQARIKEFHDEYGPVVRVAPDELSFIDAAAWRDIYSVGVGHKGFEKNWAVSSAQGFPALIDANDDDHTRIRKLLQNSFSAQALRDRERLLQKYVSLLICRLREKAEPTAKGTSQGGDQNVVNIVEWFNFTTFDITGELTFSESFGCLEDEIYDPWIAMIFSHLKASALSIGFRFYYPLDKILMWCLPKHLLKQKERFIQLSKDKVRRRIHRALPEVRHGDFMSSALNATDKEGMTLEEMDGTFSTLIIGGSETTATLLSGVTNYLCKNPEKLKKLAEEVRRAFDTEDEITLSSTGGLPYLTAVLQEGLRMCPPIPCGLTRMIPSKGARIAGHWVPGGVGVAVTQWAAYRSESNFARPDEFLPERWLSDASSAPFAGDVRAVFQPFHVGARNCLGQNIAWAEMRLIIGRMVWNFDISSTCDLDWSKQKTYMLWQKEPFYVCLKDVTAREREQDVTFKPEAAKHIIKPPHPM